MRSAVALGSNLGDRVVNLRAARAAIVDLANVMPPIVSSPIYETEPVGMEPDAANVLNAVLEFEYTGEPNDLLKQLLKIEESLGRERRPERNASRKIDIDLLYCGEHKIDPPSPGSGAAGNEGLTLPHPRVHLRKFVLQPLSDIRPELVLPNQERSVRELLAEVADPGKVVRLMEKW